MNRFWRYVAAKIQQAGYPLEANFKVSSIAGGDINEAYQITSAGGKFFVKVNRADTFDRFIKEVDGLQLLAAANAFRVPSVIELDTFEDKSFLVLEYIEIFNQGEATRLADSLAKLHLVSFESFGLKSDNYIGSSMQSNSICSNWVEFFTEQRLGIQLEWLKHKYSVKSLVTNATRLLDQIPVFFDGYKVKPSLVHGDLWQGNYGFTQSAKPVTYDPAVYYGDHEVDLAMMELFGTPGAIFFGHYSNLFPIHPGYVQRRDLYNLYHLLNHVNLFGRSYQRQCETCIDRLLRYCSLS